MRPRPIHRYNPLWVHAVTALVTFASAHAFVVQGAPFGDDHSAHYALSMHIADLLQAGFTDFYWDQMNLGLPLFASYQPLPSLVTGVILAVTQSFLPTLVVFKCLVISVWATMPITWYVGARWMGASHLKSLLIGLLILSVRQIEHVGLGFTSSAFEGLYTQSWGLWWLPLGVGAFYRTVLRRDLPSSITGLLFALTIMSHIFTGLLMLMGCGLLTLTHVGDRKRQATAMAAVGGWSLLLVAFWLIPLIAYRQYLGGLPWMNDTYDGWAITQSLGSFIRGDLLDAGRWPVLTLLSLAGVTLVVKRLKQSPISQAGIFFFGLTLLLMGGREVWGELYGDVPLHRHVNPVRYITALQVLGVVAGAMFVERLIRKISCEGWRQKLVFAALYLAWIPFHVDFLQSTLRTLPLFESPLHRVAGELAAHGNQRFMVGGEFKTGSHFHRDLLPYLSGRGQLQSYSLGYHATLSTYYAEHMKPTRSGLRLFNVTSLVARNDASVPEPFEFYRGMAGYKIYRVPGSEGWSYFDLVRPGFFVDGDLRGIRGRVSELSASLFETGQVLVINPHESVRTESHSFAGPVQGRITGMRRELNGFQARVDLDEKAWLLLKVNFFPYWHAMIDGQPTSVHHVGPNFMAVSLAEGRHRVDFVYRNPIAQKLGAVISLVLMLVIGVAFMTRRRQDVFKVANS